MRKSLFVILFTFFTSNLCKAQFYKPVIPSTEFTNALEKIVLDFRFNFKTIQGNTIANQEAVDTYESKVKLPGANENTIFNYHSQDDTTASWQGLMYKGDDFKEAARVYENVFKLIKKSQIRGIDKSLSSFSGELQKPSEALRFTVSTLHFASNDDRYKNFIAEVELVSTYDSWVVHLNFETKPSDIEKVQSKNLK